MISLTAVKEKLAEYTKIPTDKITDDTEINELVADSFMLVELMLVLQEEFNLGLTSEDLGKVKNVSELTQTLIMAQKRSAA